MYLDIDFNLVKSQKLLLTPRLKQALNILGMSSQDLFRYVEEQLEANPVLEFEDEKSMCEDDYIASLEQIGWEKSLSDKGDLLQSDDDIGNFTDEFAIDRTNSRLSLKEHLLFQLHTSNIDRDRVAIGEYLIDNLDENGYLAVNISEVSAHFNIPARRVTEVMRIVQTFDPPGVCARNLKECLLIQLKQYDGINQVLVDIIRYNLDDLAAGRVSKIARSREIDPQRVLNFLQFIKTLEPKPGRVFYQCDNIKYIIPDINLKVMNGKFKVLVNEEAVPYVNISSYYKQMAEKDVSEDIRKFINNKVNNAVWLMKCIEQRKDILRRITECIVEEQADFFDKGRKYLKSLELSSLAQRTGLHEIVIRRAVKGKYLQCVWGIFDLSYFINKL